LRAIIKQDAYLTFEVYKKSEEATTGSVAYVYAPRRWLAEQGRMRPVSTVQARIVKAVEGDWSSGRDDPGSDPDDLFYNVVTLSSKTSEVMSSGREHRYRIDSSITRNSQQKSLLKLWGEFLPTGHRNA
jgi:hypothetical protein